MPYDRLGSAAPYRREDYFFQRTQSPRTSSLPWESEPRRLRPRAWLLCAIALAALLFLTGGLYV